LWRFKICIMKKIILFFLLISKIAFSQEANDKIIYLDSLWKETTKEDYKYYRIIKDYNLEKEEYTFEDYFKSGKIQMRGKSESKDYLTKKGEFNFYFENGTLKKTIFYENGRPKGTYLEWYDNGQKCMEAEYITDDKNLTSDLKIQNYWDKKNVQKVIDGNGELEEKSAQENASGKIKNGLKDGVWTGENKNFNITYTETYLDGKLKNGVSIDSLKMEHPYTELFLQPRPMKGLQHFYKYIAKKFNIPKNSSNINGKIILGFIIDKDGSIADLKIIKSINPDLDEEAKRLVSEYPDWSCGVFRGVKIKTSYAIPIKIQTPSE
jgi:antitoxin component YwqK of YwqJK toxin-antitoxin module